MSGYYKGAGLKYQEFPLQRQFAIVSLTIYANRWRERLGCGGNDPALGAPDLFVVRGAEEQGLDLQDRGLFPRDLQRTDPRPARKGRRNVRPAVGQQ